MSHELLSRFARLSHIGVACIFLCLLFSMPESYPKDADGYIKARCVIHVHTTISSGYLTFEEYVRLAKEKDIDAVIITDNASYRYEYGLWPLRRILKKVVERGSILKYGPRKYLEDVEKANKVFKDVLIIDGAQVNPFYFWTGSPFKGNLTLHNRNKDMLVVGLGDAEGYKNLPLVANRRLRFDQYHGDKFTEPYQELIDYASRRGALTFWSHPEIEENLSISGVQLVTIPYPYELLGTIGYTGFGIFAEGYKTIGKPLGLWDRILTEYCLGKRANPIWAIGELEYGGEENKKLNDTINVLYVKKLDRENILAALKTGRFYVASKHSHALHLVLDEFILTEEITGKSAMMGETLTSEGAPIVKIKLSPEKSLGREINMKIIRNNKVIKELITTGPIDIEFKDEEVLPNDLVYYRIDAINQDLSRLISNPVFFKRVLGQIVK